MIFKKIMSGSEPKAQKRWKFKIENLKFKIPIVAIILATMGCAGLKPIPLRVYHLTFTLDQPALATAMVVDSEGNEVAVLWSNKAVSAGVLKVDWDGRDKDGKDVAPGSYRVLVSPIRYDLKPLGNFGGQGATPGRFLNPEGLCAYPQGARLTVAVADTGNNRVQLLTDQGGFLQSAGDFGSGEEALNHPTDVDWDGQILTVCDSQNHRLALFDGKGSFLSQVVKLTGLQTSLGGAPPVLDFQDPQCLRHDAGAFWVSDAGHGILFHVTNTGGVLDEIGAKFPLANDGPFLPVGGDFWVKTGRAQVQIVDSNGNVLDEVKADPPFKNVSGFAASAQNFNLISDTDNGLLYLVDNNGRVFESLAPEGATHPGALSLWEDQLFLTDPDQNEVFHYQVTTQKLPDLQMLVKINPGEPKSGS